MKPQARRKARTLALQAVYQWQLTDDQITDLKLQFLDKINSNKVDAAYFNVLLDGVLKNAQNLDAVIIPLLDRKIKDLDMVELAVLRLAVYELMHVIDVPYKVIINEALELTKKFGSIDGYKYINGVLDKAARELRASEIV